MWSKKDDLLDSLLNAYEEKPKTLGKQIVDEIMDRGKFADEEGQIFQIDIYDLYQIQQKYSVNKGFQGDQAFIDARKDLVTLLEMLLRENEEHHAKKQRILKMVKSQMEGEYHDLVNQQLKRAGWEGVDRWD